MRELSFRADSAVRTIQAGCDLIMMSAHWTDTNRCLGLAQDLLNYLDGAPVDNALFQASQNRINKLLSNAPEHSVHALPDATFAAHSTISKAY
jgi:beta-N-acetylhexosaminidase